MRTCAEAALPKPRPPFENASWRPVSAKMTAMPGRPAAAMPIWAASSWNAFAPSMPPGTRSWNRPCAPWASPPALTPVCCVWLAPSPTWRARTLLFPPMWPRPSPCVCWIARSSGKDWCEGEAPLLWTKGAASPSRSPPTPKNFIRACPLAVEEKVAQATELAGLLPVLQSLPLKSAVPKP